MKEGTKSNLALGHFAAISVMYFTNSLSQTILFPFAAVMVSSFNVTDDPAKLGYYAGYLASSVFTGSLISSSFWGALSDRIGRKPVLLTGLSVNIICALLFGMSRSFAWAMTVRFINGLFSTILATGRSAVAELCDESNQAQGFALIGTSFGAGLLIGPALGGFLCLPSEKYPGLFPPGSFFDNFPFLLPCIILSVLSFIGVLSTLFFLPETLGRARRGSSAELSDEEYLKLEEEGGVNKEAEPHKIEGSGLQESLSDVSEPLLGLSEEEKEESKGLRFTLGKWGLNFFKSKPSKSTDSLSSAEDKMSLIQVILAKDTVVSSLIFCVLSFISTSFNEDFPLWCITPWEIGGLSFGTDQIGLLQTVAGLSMIPMQMYVYAPLVNLIGAVNALRLAVGVGLIQILFPLSKLFGRNSLGLELSLAVFMVLRSFPQCVFTSVFILISNSVENPQYLGAVNGITQTLNMSFRAIAPTAAGSFFAWSASNRGRFINSDLWFYVIGALYVLMFSLTFLFTSRVEKRKFVTVNEEDESSS